MQKHEKPFTEQAPEIEKILGENVKIIRNHQDGFHAHTGIASFTPNSEWTQGKAFIKLSTIGMTQQDIEATIGDYEHLRRELGEIVPRALFYPTHINERLGLITIADYVDILLSIPPRTDREKNAFMRNLYYQEETRQELSHLLKFARRTEKSKDNPKLLDIYGLNNLVITKSGDIRYVDTHRVFFHPDLPDVIEMNTDDREDYMRVIHTCEKNFMLTRKMLAETLRSLREDGHAKK